MRVTDCCTITNYFSYYFVSLYQTNSNAVLRSNFVPSR